MVGCRLEEFKVKMKYDFQYGHVALAINEGAAGDLFLMMNVTIENHIILWIR